MDTSSAPLDLDVEDATEMRWEELVSEMTIPGNHRMPIAPFCGNLQPGDASIKRARYGSLLVQAGALATAICVHPRSHGIAAAARPGG